MELYYQSSGTLYLSVYVNGVLTDADASPTVTIVRLSDNTTIVDAQTADHIATGRYAYTTTSTHNAALGKFRATWTYVVNSVTYTKTEYYEVVVPYARAQEVKDYFSDLVSQSSDEIYRKEKLARRIVNMFCNQTFDFESDATKSIFGADSNNLRLPKRLFAFTSCKIDNTEDITSSVEFIASTPNYLSYNGAYTPGYYEVKTDYLYDSKFFKSGLRYYVRGDWGWQSVPENVNLATILLINDYFNDESLLRRHGVYQAAIGDTQYTFNNDLWYTTGNYDVDLLLGSYTNHGVIVI